MDHHITNSRFNLQSISLFLMLELLHIAIWYDFGSLFSKSLFLAHFGFFLLWQPIWKQSKSFSLVNTAVFIAGIFCFVYWQNLWLIVVWIILLVGFIGGIYKQSRSEHLYYMFTLIFLISELLIGCNSQLFDIKLNIAEQKAFGYGMLYIPLSLFLFRQQSNQQNLSVDLLRAISSALLISLLTLGSLLFMFHTGTNYFDALIRTILSIAISLVIISWLLSPKLGFSGLSQLWYQSLLNIGTPFEKWLNDLYTINQRIESPDHFIKEAMNELTHINWISGIDWELPHMKGKAGEMRKYTIPIKINDLKTTFHTNILAGGALILHSRLLVRLIENMYTSKVQAHKLSQQTHLKNIHEAGARITHDIKNLLQSLNTITAMASKESFSADKKQKLITQQLPNITQRLQHSLTKLQSPDATEEIVMTRIETWLMHLQSRLDMDLVSVDSDIQIDHKIPAGLFDRVIDNLFDNAYYKQQVDNTIRIDITLLSTMDEISLVFTDTGEAIPKHITKKLFKEIIPSESGLGIGLYQTAKQARLNEYDFLLSHNETGNVEFTLKKNLR